MILCKVTASVVSTKKNDHLKGYKLMIVREISPYGEFIGNPFLAIDATSAGKGDKVIVIKDGGSLQMITGSKKIPENAIIAAVVDNLQINTKII